jgi:hypothetical protein
MGPQLGHKQCVMGRLYKDQEEGSRGVTGLFRFIVAVNGNTSEVQGSTGELHPTCIQLMSHDEGVARVCKRVQLRTI